MFNKENITSRSNLENNNSLSTYLGYSAQQNPNAYESFYNLILKVKPSRILEIGTASGGFTMFLKLCCDDLKLNVEIRSYDINVNPNYEYFKKTGIDIRVENVFNVKYTTVKQEVIDFIKGEGVTLVLCDGGYKIGEFNLLSKYIKPGDIIMAHDYAPDRKYFNEHINKKLWNWHEIEDKDIKNSCLKHNLIDCMDDEFKLAVWVCKMKK